jgi:hypothetical protein
MTLYWVRSGQTQEHKLEEGVPSGGESMRDVVHSVRTQSIRIECGLFDCIRGGMAGKKLRNLRV